MHGSRHRSSVIDAPPWSDSAAEPHDSPRMSRGTRRQQTVCSRPSDTTDLSARRSTASACSGQTLPPPQRGSAAASPRLDKSTSVARQRLLLQNREQGGGYYITPITRSSGSACHAPMCTRTTTSRSCAPASAGCRGRPGRSRSGSWRSRRRRRLPPPPSPRARSRPLPSRRRGGGPGKCGADWARAASGRR